MEIQEPTVVLAALVSKKKFKNVSYLDFSFSSP